jgi:hypothetical protein
VIYLSHRAAIDELIRRAPAGRTPAMTMQNPDVRGGILRAFDAGTYKATVQFTGSLQQYVGGVNVSRNIASGELTAGRKVAVAFLDPSNHTDAVLFAVWT